MIMFSALILSVVLTVAMIPVSIAFAGKMRMVDTPDERKIHAAPIPRCGGIAMAVGTASPLILWYSQDPFMQALLMAAGTIVFFGALDDCFDISPRWKFLGQIISSLLIIVWGGIQISSLGTLLPEGVFLPHSLSWPFTLLVLVGVTNAVNLSDGLDGLAGGVSLLNVCFLSYLAYVVGNIEIATAAVALFGAIFAFLRFNTHPASIFMGDAGSQMLGFATVALALKLTQWRAELISPVLPLLLFGLPVLDTLTVMFTRIRAGGSPFAPDRRHFHHRLLQLGLTHREAVLAIYGLQGFFLLLAFLLRFQTAWVILLTYISCCLTILGFFAYASRAKELHRSVTPTMGLRRWFQAVREQHRVQRFLHPAFCFLFYSLVLYTGLTPAPLEQQSALLVILVAAILATTWRFRPDFAVRLARIIVYIACPFAIYSGQFNAEFSEWDSYDRVLSWCFILQLLLGISLSLFSTRQKGIWNTPLDFLLVTIMILIPNLAEISFNAQKVGMIGLKSVVLMLSFEVLVAESRGSRRGLMMALLASLVIFAVRSLAV